MTYKYSISLTDKEIEALLKLVSAELMKCNYHFGATSKQSQKWYEIQSKLLRTGR